ncbi:serine/threonine protein kinase [Myxococcaceae bacterium JPH2]|nr:serine/threonine protein kinase [Myxococcaceae bacterium JPH2]
MSASYRLVGRVESGDLAELYDALQLPAGEVAVKLFHPKTSDPAYARDLADTTRALQPVRHPGILHVLDMGFVKQRLAVVRQDVDGATLGVALQRLNTKEVLLPTPVALHIVIQLLDAVQLAHEAGVVHGALTPGNLLLSREGLPAVCDFGALKALLAVPQLKKSFANRGRSAYRALEVSRGEAPTAQSDIYSLGAVAYELLTLREAVVPGSGVSTRRESLPPPSRLDRRLNARMDPIIMRALDPTPQRRFRSCGEFAGALRNFLSASGGMPGPEDVRRFVGELFPNEVSVATLGPVPFADDFTLLPVSGAEVESLHAEELEASVVQRAPYSRSLTDMEAVAETQEASPMFEEYRPQDFEPQEDAPIGSLTHAGTAPVAEGEGTAFESPEVIAQAWDAPPGAAPAKSRRPHHGASGAVSAKPAQRNPRVKVIEDFAEPLPPEDDDEPSIFSRRAAALAAARAGPPRGADAKARSDIALPPPSSVSNPIVGKRLATEEFAMARAAERRARLRVFVLSASMIGACVVAIGAWRMSNRTPSGGSALDERPPMIRRAPTPAPPNPPPDGEFRNPSALRPITATPPVAVPMPAEDDGGDAEDAATRAQRGYLSLHTNVPATVYIDGIRLNRRTPLVRYPVKVGSRHIRVVANGTGEDKSFDLRFTRGQHQKLEEHFQSPRR